MTSYTRRPNNVVNCTDIYVHDIEKLNETTCDDSGGDCVWIGRFKPKIYNPQDVITYAWSVDTGIIHAGQTDEECEVWITGTHPLDFEMTVTVTASNGTHTMSYPFTTTKMIP